MEIPRESRWILETLHQAGYSACLVGGCVRDSVLGKAPHDWDIATAALPQQTKALFPHTIDTGLRHGTVTVLVEGQPFEVTTFRKETGYSDHRHPDGVIFVGEVETDLARRDFTINAMAYSPETGLIDPFGGWNDCKKGILRCVGEPTRRFEEDALRILRGLRFAARLGFALEPKTAAAMKALYHQLGEVSAERIQTELMGMMAGNHLTTQLLLDNREILGFVMPELKPCFDFAQHNPHHSYDVYGHLCHTAYAAAAFTMPELPRLQQTVEVHRAELVLGALLHDIGKPSTFFTDEAGIGHFHGHPKAGVPLARAALKRLKFPNRVMDRVLMLVEYHDTLFDATEKTARRLFNRLGMENLLLLLAIHLCDMRGQGTGKEDTEEWQRSLALCRTVEGWAAAPASTGVKALAITGNDLIALGFTPGKAVGETLKALLERVLEQEIPNEKASLLKEAEKYLGTVKKNT